MKYNDMYKFRIANHGKYGIHNIIVMQYTLLIVHAQHILHSMSMFTVVVENQRMFVEFDQNPAYNTICSTKIQKGGTEEEAASSANRRQLEHTYESLSNFHVHGVQ